MFFELLVCRRPNSDRAALAWVDAARQSFLDGVHHFSLLEGVCLALMGNIFVNNAGRLNFLFDIPQPQGFLPLLLLAAFFYLSLGLYHAHLVVGRVNLVSDILKGKADASGEPVTDKEKEDDSLWIYDQCTLAFVSQLRSSLVFLVVGFFLFLVFAVTPELPNKCVTGIFRIAFFPDLVCVVVFIYAICDIVFNLWRTKKVVQRNGAKDGILNMNKKSVIRLGVFLLAVAVAVILMLTQNSPEHQMAVEPSKPQALEVDKVKVGYLAITPNLPFYVAIEKELFKSKGLTVEPILFQTSNQLVEALVTKRIDFTTVTALSVVQALEAAAPSRLKIYQVNYIPKSDPNDFLLVKVDSPYQKIEDLKGKKIALFPGSNFNVWAKLIFGEHFGFGDELITVSMPPQNHIEGLAAGSIDASYCLEPTATIAEVKKIGRVLDVGLVCKYIFDPFPVTGNCVLSEFAQKNPNTTRVFCDVMYQAMAVVHENPDECRQYFTTYCNLHESIAAKVKLGHGKPSAEVDVVGLQRTADIYMAEGVFDKPVDMRAMLLYLPKD